MMRPLTQIQNISSLKVFAPLCILFSFAQYSVWAPDSVLAESGELTSRNEPASVHPRMGEIVVTGRSQVVLNPDSADIDVTFSGAGSSFAAAQLKITDKLTLMRKFLSSEPSLVTQKIDTGGAELRRGGPVRLLQRYSLRVTGMDTVPSILDALAASGGVELHRVRPSVSYEAKALQGAYETAIARARKLAEKLAAQEGVKLHAPTKIVTSEEPPAESIRDQLQADPEAFGSGRVVLDVFATAHYGISQ